jgi:hypothetical protein
MEVNYHVIVFQHWPQVKQTLYVINLLPYFNPRKRRYLGKFLQYFYNIGTWPVSSNLTIMLEHAQDCQSGEIINRECLQKVILFLHL